MRGGGMMLMEDKAMPMAAPAMAAESIVTYGLRSGDSAIDRNSIDAILNNPNRGNEAARSTSARISPIS
jgi:hypothetical protein